MSLLASVLIAVRERSGPKKELANLNRYILIAVPAVSPAFATTQFHLAEVLRGRLDAIAQIEDLQGQLQQSRCDAGKIDAIHKALIRLERAQYTLPGEANWGSR